MDTSEVQNALGAIMGKLEALERSNAALEARVAMLDAVPPGGPRRPESAIARAVDTRIDGQASRGGTTSRRMWLKRAAGAAVASVAAGAMLERDTGTAAAGHTTQDIDVDSVTAHLVQALPDGGVAIYAYTTNQSGPAVVANNLSSSPLANVGGSGVGVWGLSFAATGVRGESYNHLGYGVHGMGQAGVVGESSTTGYEGVYGHHLGPGTGFGVVGDAAGASSAGMLGRNPNATGDGMRGEGKVGVHGKSGTTGGNAVWGEATGSTTGVAGTSAGGYGGYFKGGKAQLKLAPSGTAGKPTAGAHTKGELYMDSTATLYVCTVAGTPGTWRRLTTTTA